MYNYTFTNYMYNYTFINVLIFKWNEKKLTAFHNIVFYY